MLLCLLCQAPSQIACAACSLRLAGCARTRTLARGLRGRAPRPRHPRHRHRRHHPWVGRAAVQTQQHMHGAEVMGHACLPGCSEVSSRPCTDDGVSCMLCGAAPTGGTPTHARTAHLVKASETRKELVARLALSTLQCRRGTSVTCEQVQARQFVGQTKKPAKNLPQEALHCSARE